MLYAIYATDRPDTHALREAHYPAHRTHLGNAAVFGVTLMLSGPLVAEDGVTAIGSLFIVDAPDHATAENFHLNDPFCLADVWESSRVTRFEKRRGWGV